MFDLWYNIDVTEVLNWTPTYPYIPDNPKKQLFMDFRIAGHEIDESVALTGITKRTYYLWLKQDRNFDYWNGPGLEHLRKKNREKLIGDIFVVNSNLVQQYDRVFLTKIHLKKNRGEKLTDEERKILDKLRNVYAMPSQLKVMQEMVEGDKPTKEGMSLMDYINKLDRGETITIVDGEYVEESDEVPPLRLANDDRPKTTSV